MLVATKSTGGLVHNDNGTKSITISGSVTSPAGTSYAGHTSSGSGTATFVEMLSLGYEESNVDDFIIKALQFRQYAKWNAYHYANDERPYNDEISNLVAQGDACKSTPSVATSFYQKAYDKCMDAYNAFKGKTNYGMKECADYYYNLSIIITARITQTNTTSEQNDAYNTSWDEYIKIHQEYTDDLKEMWSIIDSFPKKLY